jgi:hypothetical protein
MEGFSEIVGRRGHQVFDSEGVEIGRLEEIYGDQATNAPIWGRVEIDPAEHRYAFVPLDGASPVGADLRIAFDRKLVFGAPAAGADEQISAGVYEELHRYYGLVPEQPLEVGWQPSEWLSPKGGPEPLGPPDDWP